jgi:hypothetical protein
MYNNSLLAQAGSVRAHLNYGSIEFQKRAYATSSVCNQSIAIYTRSYVVSWQGALLKASKKHNRRIAISWMKDNLRTSIFCKRRHSGR